jgi:hypothetical protein
MKNKSGEGHEREREGERERGSEEEREGEGDERREGERERDVEHVTIGKNERFEVANAKQQTSFVSEPKQQTKKQNKLYGECANLN